MRILEIHDGELRPATRPTPVPGPGEVLLEVAAAGVNRADLMQLAGHYPPPPGVPDWPGLEVAGRVVAVGPALPDIGPVGDGANAPTPTSAPTAEPLFGSRRAALLAGGGYASHAVVPLAHTLAIPETLTDVQAAALPEALATVWSTLVGVGERPLGVRAGETVLVIGGSGGIGTTAVQVARALGARVLATAGGPTRVAEVAALGADAVFDHRALTPADLTAMVLDATQDRGVDVILDVQGGPALNENVLRLAVGGRLVVIATQAGRRGDLDLAQLLRRRASIHAATLRARPAAEKAAIMHDVVTHLLPHVASGAITPRVHAAYPLAEAGPALRALAAGEVFGKVVLLP